jgi:hypothetical protein
MTAVQQEKINEQNMVNLHQQMFLSHTHFRLSDLYMHIVFTHTDSTDLITVHTNIYIYIYSGDDYWGDLPYSSVYLPHPHRKMNYGNLDRAIVKYQSSKFMIHGATVMEMKVMCATKWCQQKQEDFVAPHQLSLVGLLCVVQVNLLQIWDVLH